MDCRQLGSYRAARSAQITRREIAISLTIETRLLGSGWPNAQWLPRRLTVTKVQLPNLYHRNLDKPFPCVTFEDGPPSASAEGTCPSAAPGRGEPVL
jgi:hypothetical protein